MACSTFPSMLTNLKVSPPLLDRNKNINLAVKKVRPLSLGTYKVSHIECCMDYTGGRPEYSVDRSDFPQFFLFGASSSAVQTEGAPNMHGKGPSMWDHYIQRKPDKIYGGENIDVACDSYHKFKDDIAMLKCMGATSYRFSIAWTRILPKGSLKGGINWLGIDHYNKVLDELKRNGITPIVTLLHFDSPQALEEQYQGLLSRNFVYDFRDYCDVCFRHFGDRVKHWITINEPSLAATFGYSSSGEFAPGRCSNREYCEEGDSAREPYLVAHHMILSHATAAQLYRNEYKAKQGGELGIAFVCSWFLPYSDSPGDLAALDRIRDFNLGWFMDPLVYGRYPFIMKKLVKDRLPTFDEDEKKMIMGSLDFVGVNYYYSNYAQDMGIDPFARPVDWKTDTCVRLSKVNARGETINELKDDDLFFGTYPDGLRQVLVYLTQRYDNPKIYITENGNAPNRKFEITTLDGNVETREARIRPIRPENDMYRIQYIKGHLDAVRRAMEEGSDVRGYFAWSLMDSFEFRQGYSIRFGLWYTNYGLRQVRIAKWSAIWYSAFLNYRNQNVECGDEAFKFVDLPGQILEELP